MLDTETRSELESWLRSMDIALSPGQWGSLERYLEDLENYNRKVNLTSDSGSRLALRHVADGLAPLPTLRGALSALRPPRLLDLGAGAGFVGISIKIAWPEAEVTLLESAWRKFQFLNWEAARLGVRGLRVLWRRAADGPAVFDAVLARAVAPLPELLGPALSHARPQGGLVVAYQTQAPEQGKPRLRRILENRRATFDRLVSYRLPQESKDRRLAIFKRLAGKPSGNPSNNPSKEES